MHLMLLCKKEGGISRQLKKKSGLMKEKEERSYVYVATVEQNISWKIVRRSQLNLNQQLQLQHLKHHLVPSREKPE